MFKENIKKINILAKRLSRVKIMELCGTHSQTIAHYNLKDLLPSNIELISGPGCPVCVTDQTDVDIMVNLALNNIPVAAYGDALALPGSESNLEKVKQQGKNVFVVYSIEDALKLKKRYPKLVFFGIGFETTAPMSAWAIREGLNVYSSHKLFPPAMAALLSNSKIKIDGFINPGHVSAIIGIKPYLKFNIPQVISGFEPEDIIESIMFLLELIINRKNKVINQYKRAVQREGNLKARNLIFDVFGIGNASWRGLGTIPDSGLKIKKKWRNHDAEYVYKELVDEARKKFRPQNNACICGQVLQGLKKPKDCLLFSKVCVPEDPQGACMVSVEGACQIEYKNL